MSRGLASNSKHSYTHLNGKGPSEAIDVHDITVKKSRLRIFSSYSGAAVFLTATLYLVVLKELCISSIWSILVCFSLAKVLHHKPVKKESVVIMPAFGVQLETHYWSLALILRDEDELTLVFQKLQPPVRMLVPVWKKLCAATDCKGNQHHLNLCARNSAKK
ncbi:GPI-GlcNAc transferase complex, PIG-H component [Musa troglodytarum]|uniref:GPI-GlcNAc transferase complex, PIG-H component n=1 Tax=Musa troglodytarum TaxID=320322 RepID=A0A9E7GIP6_9LILI|nr:GPI-GlcNAc transferase complex, PIG-H component [Musa troglodytarum]